MFGIKKLKAENQKLKATIDAMNGDYNDQYHKTANAERKLSNADLEVSKLRAEIVRLTDTQACLFFQDFNDNNLDVIAIERRLNGTGLPVTNITYRFKDINELNIMAFHISMEEHNKLVNKFLPTEEES